MYHIISPHIDDAAFSVGGILISLTKRKERVRVINVFSTSQWTNPSVSSHTAGLTKERVTEIRKSEENKASRELGYESYCLDFDDVLLRDTAANEFIRHDVKVRLLEILPKNDPIIFPIGLLHTDHILLREIGLELLDAGYPVLFFEDQPYVASADGQKQKTMLASIHELIPIEVPITLPEKNTLMKIYESQLSKEWINMINSYILNQNSELPIERLWKPKTSDFSFEPSA